MWTAEMVMTVWSSHQEFLGNISQLWLFQHQWCKHRLRLLTSCWGPALRRVGTRFHSSSATAWWVSEDFPIWSVSFSGHSPGVEVWAGLAWLPSWISLPSSRGGSARQSAAIVPTKKSAAVNRNPTPPPPKPKCVFLNVCFDKKAVKI